MSIIIFGLRKINQKNPHKYIGGKKKKSPNKIKSTDIILCFLFQCLTHAIRFFRSNSKYPPDFYLYDKFSSIISVKKSFMFIVTDIVLIFVSHYYLLRNPETNPFRSIF